MLAFQIAHLLYNGLLLGAVVLIARSAKRRPGVAWLLAPPALVFVGLPLAGFVGLPLGIGAFAMIGLFACAVFLHVPLAYLFIGRAHRERPGIARTSYAVVVAIAAVAVFSFLIEPYRLELSHVRIETDKVSEPVRIAILADIQTNHVGEHERKAVAMAMAEEPDLVLLPGDFIQVRNLERRLAEAAALRDVFLEVGLDAPLGAYAVRGNIDPDQWPHGFSGTDVHLFHRSGSVRTGELTVSGLDLFESFDDSLEWERGEGYHVVFGHGPDFALSDAVDADLLIAGHCHGGQVRLPWLGPIMTLSSVPRAWTSGATELSPGKWLVVSRGIGMERGGAPPLRFLCRPEVVIVDLVPTGTTE